MKKQLFIISLMLAATSVMAQSETGKFSLIPRLGLSLSKVANEDIAFSSSDAKSPKYRSGFMGGLDVQYQATQNIAFSIGAFYARMGSKYNDSDLSTSSVGTYTVYSNLRTVNDYIDVPLMLHYYVSKGLSVNVGVQGGFLLNSKLKGDSRSVTIGEDGTYTYDTNTEKIDTDNDAKSFDFAIPVGLSYEYQNVILDARYNIGLTKVSKSIDDSKNHGFFFSVGYRI